MSRAAALVLAAVLVALGILAFSLQGLGKPEVECAEEGAPSSGFVDDESGCPITQQSFEEIRDYESGPQVFRIAGLVLIVTGAGAGVYGLTRKNRPHAPRDPDAPAAG
jgi:hypothetical protein